MPDEFIEYRADLVDSNDKSDWDLDASAVSDSTANKKADCHLVDNPTDCRYRKGDLQVAHHLILFTSKSPFQVQWSGSFKILADCLYIDT